MDFSYILKKIESAEFADSPFRHLEINNLFEDRDFAEITASVDVTLPEVLNDNGTRRLIC